MIEPLACVLRGLEETGVRDVDTVTVIGLGSIGLMFVRMAKLAGARVIAVGRRPQQLERAEKMGADELVTFAERADAVAHVRGLTEEGLGSDVVVEAVGTPETWQSAMEMVRSGGTVNFFGGCPSGSHIRLDTSLMHYSEVTLKSSFHHTPRHIRSALDVISRRDLRADDFVINEAPLSELLDVFRHMMGHNGHLKTAIVP